jgi:hypothetical protein
MSDKDLILLLLVPTLLFLFWRLGNSKRKQSNYEEPEFQTPLPFIIKIHHDYFHVSGIPDSVNPEDDFQYKNVKSIRINTGNLNIKNTIAYDVLSDLSPFHSGIDKVKRVNDSDELIIEFLDGKSERRYLNGTNRNQINEAIERINKRLPHPMKTK